MKLLPIGTILQVQDKKMIILGYRMEEEEEFKHYYIGAAYPLGIVDRSTLALLPIQAPYDVVFEGYKDSSYESFIINREQLYELTLQNTPEQGDCEFQKAVNAIEKIAGKGMEA